MVASGRNRKVPKAALASQLRAETVELVKGWMVGPDDSPARLVAGDTHLVGEPQIAHGYELVVPIQQRNASAHPRDDRRFLEPALQRARVRSLNRPEVLAARSKAQREAVVEPRFGQA